MSTDIELLGESNQERMGDGSLADVSHEAKQFLAETVAQMKTVATPLEGRYFSLTEFNI
ncbi:hypothetical protein [Caballeronia sp. GAOx1]|uniref:hypothetical protein n=1 Tax=Caballeronia sp. GAOx1 TaxID=2921761 RepID=UPI0020296FFC|nr:hypothetical protein [Caballeronia sp. GAOx1]